MNSKRSQPAQSHFGIGSAVTAIAVALVAAAAAAAPPGPTTSPAVTNAERSGAIHVYLGNSQIVNSPWPVTRVSITSPDVADVQVLAPGQVLVQGKSVGSTDLIFWGKQEDQVWRSKVDVDADIDELRKTLAMLFPDGKLVLGQSGRALVISGTLARAEQAQQLRRLMDSRKFNYLDMTSLAGTQQVQLQIRLAEVDRQAIRALGINLLHTGHDFFGGSTIGSAGGGPINPIQIGPPSGASASVSKVPFVFNQDVGVSPGVTLFGGFPSAGLEFFIQAIRENQYMRILAEPTLVAVSGEEASFLAGGEFPVPIVQSTTGGTGTSISVEYKQFGVRLFFRPIVLGDGSIRLKVAPEVSELTDVGAVVISGFVIPALQTRRSETTLEMKSGQTFAMAGLINDTTVARASRIPGLGDMPVLGVLFRSVRHQRRETELVVLVKATLASPSSDTPPPLPGVTYSPPNDWELYCLGSVVGRAPARVSAVDREWLRSKGLNKLKGPGAWATYESGAQPSSATMYPPLQATSRPAE